MTTTHIVFNSELGRNKQDSVEHLSNHKHCYKVSRQKRALFVAVLYVYLISVRCEVSKIHVGSSRRTGNESDWNDRYDAILQKIMIYSSQSLRPFKEEL